MSNRNWRLPAGVGDLLPPDAWALELTRRRVLDVFRAWGFEYIDPPVVEYLDALLVGAGDDMDLQTLKALDQKSGRLLGVRADMTAQAIRVDAHSRPVAGVQRLCWCCSQEGHGPRDPRHALDPSDREGRKPLQDLRSQVNHAPADRAQLPERFGLINASSGCNTNQTLQAWGGIPAQFRFRVQHNASSEGMTHEDEGPTSCALQCLCRCNDPDVFAGLIDKSDLNSEDRIVGFRTGRFALLLASVWSTDGGFS